MIFTFLKWLNFVAEITQSLNFSVHKQFYWYTATLIHLDIANNRVEWVNRDRMTFTE